MDLILILLVIPFVLGSVGQVIKTAVLGKKPEGGYEARLAAGELNWFQKFYFSTIQAHPFVGGVLVALLIAVFDGPLPEFLIGAGGGVFVGAVLAGLFAGGVCTVGYHLLVQLVKRLIKTFRA